MAPTLPMQRSRDAGKPTLVLDLDNTLVSVADYEEGEDLLQHVTKRPGLDAFLSTMSQVYEIIVFSASGTSYVRQIVHSLDPKGEMVAAIFTGKDIDWCSGQVVKDLRKLGRDLNRVVWLDDNASLYAYNPNNGIAIAPFNGDPNDSALENLTPLLLKVAKGETSLLNVNQVKSSQVNVF